MTDVGISCAPATPGASNSINVIPSAARDLLLILREADPSLRSGRHCLWPARPTRRRIRPSVVLSCVITRDNTMKSNALLPLTALLSLAAALPAQNVQAPRFEVDPFWPKPLPTHTLLGSLTGIAIDAQDHVWVVNLTNSFTTRTETGADQDPPIGECCFPQSPVLEFDAAGKLVGHWGGPGAGCTWPTANQGIVIDAKGNVWISGTGPRDTQILEFTRDGKFIKAI